MELTQQDNNDDDGFQRELMDSFDEMVYHSHYEPQGAT